MSSGTTTASTFPAPRSASRPARSPAAGRPDDAPKAGLRRPTRAPLPGSPPAGRPAAGRTSAADSRAATWSPAAGRSAPARCRHAADRPRPGQRREVPGDVPALAAKPRAARPRHPRCTPVRRSRAAPASLALSGEPSGPPSRDAARRADEAGVELVRAAGGARRRRRCAGPRFVARPRSPIPSRPPRGRHRIGRPSTAAPPSTGRRIPWGPAGRTGERDAGLGGSAGARHPGLRRGSPGGGHRGRARPGERPPPARAAMARPFLAHAPEAGRRGSPAPRSPTRRRRPKPVRRCRARRCRNPRVLAGRGPLA